MYETRPVLVTRPQRYRRREVPSRAGARDREPRRVAAERGCVLCCPDRRRVGIVERDGEPVLRREPVVHRHDDGARCFRQRPRRCVVRRDAADDPAAAVEPHGDGQGPRVVRHRNVHPNGHVAVRPGREMVAHRRHLRPRQVRPGRLERARLLGARLVRLQHAHLDALLQRRFRFRVERHHAPPRRPDGPEYTREPPPSLPRSRESRVGVLAHTGTSPERFLGFARNDNGGAGRYAVPNAFRRSAATSSIACQVRSNGIPALKNPCTTPS